MEERLSCWLIKNGATKDNKEIYEYGIECFTNEFVSNGLILLFAFCYGQLFEMILWLFVFTLLRVNVGGYHAKNKSRCIILSTMLSCFNLVAYQNFIKYPYIIFIISFLSLCIILKISPIIHKNHPLSKKRRILVRKRCLFLSIFEFMVIIFLLFINLRLSALFFSAYLSVTLLAVLGKVKDSE